MIQKVAKKTAEGNQPQHQASSELSAKQGPCLPEEKREMLSSLLGRLIARRWVSEQQVRKSNLKSS